MKLSKESKIINEELFCETQKKRIQQGAVDKEVCIKRLEMYAYKTGKKLCNKCYEIYEEDHQCK